MSTQYSVSPYNASVNWKQYDIIYDGIYRYATQDMAINWRTGAPTLQVVYTVTGHKREDDVTTLYFTQTGNVPDFKKGSILSINNLALNSTMNYTGMVLDGGSGWCNYINPGWSEGLKGVSDGVGGTTNSPNPGWTSGFLFAPTYSTRIGTENQAIVTQLGGGYQQRMSHGLNTFNQTIGLVFQNRSDREVKAMINFIQDKGGVTAFPIMLPNSLLTNQPIHKYVAASVEVTPVAYNLNDAQVSAARVFEP